MLLSLTQNISIFQIRLQHLFWFLSSIGSIFYEAYGRVFLKPFDNFYLVSWCLSSHTFFQDSRYQKTIWLILDSHGGFLFLFYFFMRICTDIGYIFAIISSFVFHIMGFFKSKWVDGLNVNKNITRREVKLLFKSFCKQFHKTQLSSNTIF